MASQSLDKRKRAIAQNLIDTCGLQRAVHAAKQYGWNDIAEEIESEIEKSSQLGRRRTDPPFHH
ncbi:hypothetical protein [Sneathiella sp. HT1-7]|uniref:hypothetical protein n=1 Tax=Sneathiella sp. HT1-7 TaxID=2887192 RepID=UPI001D13C864|nr:hypothetical protein [Sneathiella sp. HT1-7]MCC3304837.1 hypothetical protein [Sneathiella sp. HT1-7]